jgi:DNA-binding transcriptional LysR family regulator
MFVLPMAMAMFRTQFPQVEVHVGEEVFPQVESALRESRFDFAVGPVPRPGPGPDFQVTKLFSVELVVVVRHDHPRARARSIADLMDDEWIVAGPPKGPGAIIESLFQRNHLSVPACPVHLESIFSAVETIKRTDLVGLLPLPLAQAASPSVRMLPIRERLDSLNVNIILPARSILTPAARALVSAIRISGGSWRQPAQSRSQAGPA